MTPLQHFVRSVAAARERFNAEPSDVAAWLALYDAKEAAYAKLVAVLPQAREIKDFWRYVQNMPSAAWLPIIEREILRITHRQDFVSMSPTERPPGAPQTSAIASKCQNHTNVHPRQTVDTEGVLLIGAAA